MSKNPPQKPRRVAFMLDLDWPHKRHTAIFAGAQKYAEEQGWESTIDDYVPQRLPQRLPRGRTKNSLLYDGVIGRASKQLAERANRVGLPVVNVWNSSPAWEQLPNVVSDAEASGRLCAEHLLARGLRRFVMLGRNEQGPNRQWAGFQAVVNEAGFSSSRLSLSLRSERSFAAWQKNDQRIKQFMQTWEPPIGLLATNEEIGRRVVQECRQRDWSVPYDVAIVAGENEESLCEHPRPSLTSVELGYDRIGYEAARLLDRMMDAKQEGQKKEQKKEHILLPPIGMVVRESTDFYAVDDPVVAAVLEFIAANSERQISPTDVAHAVEIGLRTLQHRFQAYLGRPISAEIQRVRIERAKRELAESDRPIQEIAIDVGFGEARRMYEAFCRELGVTPRQYRKQRRLKDKK